MQEKVEKFLIFQPSTRCAWDSLLRRCGHKTRFTCLIGRLAAGTCVVENKYCENQGYSPNFNCMIKKYVNEKINLLYLILLIMLLTLEQLKLF